MWCFTTKRTIKMAERGGANWATQVERPVCHLIAMVSRCQLWRLLLATATLGCCAVAIEIFCLEGTQIADEFIGQMKICRGYCCLKVGTKSPPLQHLHSIRTSTVH